MPKTSTARLRSAVRRCVPRTWIDGLKRMQKSLRRRVWPAPWTDLRTTRPLSDCFGFDRGRPVDRYYIEGFLNRQSADIRGRVLEIASPSYTRKFGGEQVTQSDVLHAVAGNPAATLVGDLQTGAGIPVGVFDCIILTQTLICVFDVQAALATVVRSLAPGGVALITCPGICQISRPDMDAWGEYWRFTTLSLRRHLERHLPPASITVESFGNVLAATALLHGITVEELTPAELDDHHRDYEVTIAARIVKPIA